MAALKFLLAALATRSSLAFAPARGLRHHQLLPLSASPSGRLPKWSARPSSPTSASQLESQPLLKPIQKRVGLASLARVGLPTVFTSILGYLFFDNLAVFIRDDIPGFAPTSDFAPNLLGNAGNNFIPCFVEYIALLFTILAGETLVFLYNQQETVYFALYAEVSELTCLFEEATLLCEGRPIYPRILECLRFYISNDLKRFDTPPAEQLALRPSEDPLEAVSMMTSVGAPSPVALSVASLRRARGYRLGATQRKFPALGVFLLYTLAFLELVAFPLLGAGVEMDDPEILQVQDYIFAALCGSAICLLRIIQELNRPGSFLNLDEVLDDMTRGLDDKLAATSSDDRLQLLLDDAEMMSTAWPAFASPQPQEERFDSRGGGEDDREDRKDNGEADGQEEGWRGWVRPRWLGGGGRARR